MLENTETRHTKATVGTSLQVIEVKALEVGAAGCPAVIVENSSLRKVAATVDNSRPLKSGAAVDNSSLLFHRSLADLIGSGVVYALQDILDHYIPVVGNENRDALVELVRQEANEYLDQELMASPSKSSLRAHAESLEV